MNVVAHNLQAMNSQRQLNITSSAKQKSAEKLSSGYRINRAADDAAGLAVSEKMRRQIRGLDRGVDNCEDGVSICQIADGALTEVNTMLQRLTTLTVQAANGTNAASDRADIQQEINQILSEISRIGDTTTFNGTQVFNTNYSSPVEGVSYENYSLSDLTLASFGSDINSFPLTVSYTGGVSDYAETTQLLSGGAFSDTSFTVNTTNNSFQVTAADLGTPTRVYYDNTNNTISRTYNYSNGNVQFNFTQTVSPSTSGGKGYDITYDFANQKAPITITNFSVTGTLADDSGKFYDLYSDAALSGSDSQIAFHPSTMYLGSGSSSYGVSKWSVTASASFSIGVQDSTAKILSQEGHTAGKSMWLQAGNECMEGFRLETGTLSNDYLGIEGLSVLTEEKATSAIDLVGVALQRVTAQRSTLGAQQNRLEHTIANEENTVENTTASESRIRDTDMAEEMVAYSKNSILEQAGQAMLAQANSSTQGVLSLLQ